MKSVYLLLLIALPLILCQDYAVPNLDYDTTSPTCDNINSLIADTNADIARFKNYVGVTLPARLSKLNDVYSSVKKTCDILSSSRPSLVQVSSSSTLRAERIKTLAKLSNQVKNIAHSLFEDKKNRKIVRSLVHLKSSSADPSDLCSDTYNAINNLIGYLNFLIPAVTTNYIDGALSDRLNSLTSFNGQCVAAACKPASGGSQSGASDDYIFYPTIDSGGNDITNLGGYSVQQLKDYCDQTPNCVGFNTNGWVKYSLNPWSEWYQWTTDSTLGFYAKSSAVSALNNPATSDNSNAAQSNDDYTFLPTLDSGGNDITNLAGYSVQQLKDYCDQTPNCVGFNTNGWVKYALNPLSQWSQWTTDSTLGFYAKTLELAKLAPSAAASTEDPNYWTFFPTLDSGGGDIQNLGGYSVQQLKDWCKSNSDCLGFNTNGWVKSQLQPRNQWYQWTGDTTLGFYVKSEDGGVNDDNDNAYDFYPTLDSAGGDIQNLGGYSIQQLKSYCSGNPDCLGFNSNGWVKSQLQNRNEWSQWTSDVSLGFYVKTSAASASSYTFYAGLDSGGNDITNLGGYSVDQLKAYCDQTPNCAGFNSNGWVKYALNPSSQWYQWTSDPTLGFYVKN